MVTLKIKRPETISVHLELTVKELHMFFAYFNQNNPDKHAELMEFLVREAPEITEKDFCKFDFDMSNLLDKQVSNI